MFESALTCTDRRLAQLEREVGDTLRANWPATLKAKVDLVAAWPGFGSSSARDLAVYELIDESGSESLKGLLAFSPSAAHAFVLALLGDGAELEVG